MMFDNYGRAMVTDSDLVDLLYKKPDLELEKFSLINPDKFNAAVTELKTGQKTLKLYQPLTVDISAFDHDHQQNWHMPDEYKNLDIASWVLSQCNDSDQLQRAGQELLLYQERNLFDLLKYLKYLVDVLNQHKIVWGVGRGSSVASYVLYLIGIHKINSLYYDLDIKEFLKDDNNGQSI